MKNIGSSLLIVFTLILFLELKSQENGVGAKNGRSSFHHQRKTGGLKWHLEESQKKSMIEVKNMGLNTYSLRYHPSLFETDQKNKTHDKNINLIETRINSLKEQQIDSIIVDLYLSLLSRKEQPHDRCEKRYTFIYEGEQFKICENESVLSSVEKVLQAIAKLIHQ